MKEEAIAVKLDEINSRLTQEIKALKGIDFTNNWKGPASTNIKQDYDAAVNAINTLMASVASLSTTLKRIAACKTVDPKIEATQKQITTLENTPVMDENIKVQNQELRQLRVNLEQYRNTKNTNLKSAQQSLNAVRAIQLDIPTVIEAETKYDYSTQKELIGEAFKGYSKAYNYSAWAKNSVLYYGLAGGTNNSVNNYLAYREEAKETTATTATGGKKNAPAKTSNSTSKATVNGTFTAAYMGSDTYTISSESLKDQQFSKMIAAANDCKNVKYSFGADENPATGYMDCSSFVSYLCNKSGHQVGRINSADFRSDSLTTAVSASDVRPGDIVTFSGHVGDGKMIHCNSGKWGSGVNIMNISTFQGTFLGYRRMK